MYVCSLVQIDCQFLKNQIRNFLKGNLSTGHPALLRAGHPLRLGLGAVPSVPAILTACFPVLDEAIRHSLPLMAGKGARCPL